MSAVEAFAEHDVSIAAVRQEGRGLDASLPSEPGVRDDALLFGEAPERVLLAVPGELAAARAEALCRAHGAPGLRPGVSGGDPPDLPGNGRGHPAALPGAEVGPRPARPPAVDWEVHPTTPWNYALAIDPDRLDASVKVSEGGTVKAAANRSALRASCR